MATMSPNLAAFNVGERADTLDPALLKLAKGAEDPLVKRALQVGVPVPLFQTFEGGFGNAKRVMNVNIPVLQRRLFQEQQKNPRGLGGKPLISDGKGLIISLDTGQEVSLDPKKTGVFAPIQAVPSRPWPFGDFPLKTQLFGPKGQSATEFEKNVALGKDAIVLQDGQAVPLSQIRNKIAEILDVNALKTGVSIGGVKVPPPAGATALPAASLSVGALETPGAKAKDPVSPTAQLQLSKLMPPDVKDSLKVLDNLAVDTDVDPVNRLEAFFQSIGKAPINPLNPVGFNLLQMVLAGLGGIQKATKDRQTRVDALKKEGRQLDLAKAKAQISLGQQDFANKLNIERFKADVKFKNIMANLKDKAIKASTITKRHRNEDLILQRRRLAMKEAELKSNNPKELFKAIFADPNLSAEFAAMGDQLAKNPQVNVTMQQLLKNKVDSNTATMISTIQGLPAAFREKVKQAILEKEMLKAARRYTTTGDLTSGN